MRMLLRRFMLIGALALSTTACRTIATERYHGFAELTNGIFANAQETDDRIHLEIMVAEIVSRSNAVRPPRNDPYRIAYDADIAALLENKDTIMSNLDSLEITMKHFPLAHAELMALLEKKPTNKESLSALSREAQRIEQDYQSLK